MKALAGVKIVKIDNIDLIVLKPEKFIYCGKHYTSNRYLTTDKKILITSDDGFHYTRVYTANETGKAVFCSDLYFQHNPDSYPIYNIEDALRRIKSNNLTSKHSLLIHDSQYK